MRTELHCRQQHLGLAAGRKVLKNDLQADKHVSQLNWCSWHTPIPLDAVRVRHMSEKLRWRTEEVMPENVQPVNLWEGSA